MASNSIEALLYEGGATNWHPGQPLGTPVQLSYSFMTSLPAYYAPGVIQDPRVFTDAQQTAAREALALYAEVANLVFTEVSDQGEGGILRFGNSDQGESQGGYSYTPAVGVGEAGDVWINHRVADNLDPQRGRHEYTTLLHELGHALGMKHPGNYGVGDTPPFLPAAEDSTQYTVMSYHQHPHGYYRDVTLTETGAGTQASWRYFHITPETLMPHDMAAIQYVYGANRNTRSGDDIYTFANDTPFFKTIWDGGGRDTLSAANFTRGVTLDLRAGAFSSLSIPSDALPEWASDSGQPTYDGTDNLAIAYGVSIENAVGGQGDDRLTGNGLGNSLQGGIGNDQLLGLYGNDSLDGGAGADSMTGGPGNDTYWVNNPGDRVFESANGGVDTVRAGIGHSLAAQTENLVLTGVNAIHGNGNNLANSLTGNAAANRLDGRAGNDRLNGAGGDDTLIGGAGADTLTGGAGADQFRYVLASEGGDTIADFSTASDKIQVVRGNFAQLPLGALAAHRLRINAAASSGDAVFLYANGVLSFDADGNGAGAAAPIATLSGRPNLTASHILIVAS